MIGELVAVDSTIHGPAGSAKVSLVVDTAAVKSTVTPLIAESIGFSPALRTRWSVTRTATAEERGYIVEMQLDCLGAAVNHEVMVADLGYGIDGLLGINFLRLFNVELRFSEQRIVVDTV